jgi:hypothetical protein
LALFPVRPPPAVLTAGGVVARKDGPRGRRSARAVRGDGSDDGVEGERALDALDAVLGGTPSSSSSSSKTDVGEEMDQGNVALTSSSRPHFVFREITATLDEETAANVSVRVHSASSRVVQHAQYPPLGIIIEPTQYGVEITEVTDTSSPFKEGDIIKAVSGMIPTMKYGQGNLLLGGNGRPGFNRVMCTVRSALEIREREVDEERLKLLIDVEFETCLKAIRSNGKAGDYEVVLVVERRAE